MFMAVWLAFSTDSGSWPGKQWLMTKVFQTISV
jgi:hypothetical protein